MDPTGGSFLADCLNRIAKATEKEHRHRQGLKEKRDTWLERARDAPAERRKAEEMARRFQKQMDGEKIERAKRKADRYREREWALETRDTKTLFAKMREQVMQTDIISRKIKGW